MKLIRKKGFTLIELLVVVSIISLLSSIVLGSVSDARVKAKNSKIVQEYQQLEKALWLYYDDHGRFPNTSSENLCYSDSADDFCGIDNTRQEDPIFKSEMSNYISAFPSSESVQSSGGATWEGFWGSITSTGSVVRIYYALVGRASCAGGYGSEVSQNQDINGVYTWCMHRIR